MIDAIITLITVIATTVLGVATGAAILTASPTLNGAIAAGLIFGMTMALGNAPALFTDRSHGRHRRSSGLPAALEELVYGGSQR